jgi:spermidine synthase
MDGRAWLRRCSKQYDVVTLEPMPPYFATSNALYSEEFYELVAAHLNSGGIIAQWLPFHLLPPFYAGSIVATFRTVFPDAILWIHEASGTGILLGRRGPESEELPWDWPGMHQHGAEQSPKDKQEIIASVALDKQGIRVFAELGNVITDDNQLLSFGDLRRRMFSVGQHATRINLALVAKAAEVARMPAVTDCNNSPLQTSH